MNDRHPLGRLIENVQKAEGWSDRQLEERAQGLQGLGKSNLSKLKNHRITGIRANVIKGLAEVLRVPEWKVARAALASMEIALEIEEPDSLESVVLRDTELSQRDRRILLATIREMRADDAAGAPAVGEARLAEIDRLQRRADAMRPEEIEGLAAHREQRGEGDGPG